VRNVLRRNKMGKKYIKPVRKMLGLYKEIRKTDSIKMQTKSINSMRRTQNKPQVKLDIKKELNELTGE
jgi:hypothetical protein